MGMGRSLPGRKQASSRPFFWRFGTSYRGGSSRSLFVAGAALHSLRSGPALLGMHNSAFSTGALLHLSSLRVLLPSKGYFFLGRGSLSPLLPAELWVGPSPADAGGVRGKEMISVCEPRCVLTLIDMSSCVV